MVSSLEWMVSNHPIIQHREKIEELEVEPVLRLPLTLDVLGPEEFT